MPTASRSFTKPKRCRDVKGANPVSLVPFCGTNTPFAALHVHHLNLLNGNSLSVATAVLHAAKWIEIFELHIDSTPFGRHPFIQLHTRSVSNLGPGQESPKHNFRSFEIL